MQPKDTTAQQAGILCNDAQFQAFVAHRCDLPRATTSCAAEYLRRFCKIESRRALVKGSAAQTQFEILRTEYDAWRGRIAAPRD